MFGTHLSVSSAFLGRLPIAFLFAHEAWTKLTHYGASIAYMERFSLPGLLLPGAIGLELLGGAAILIGWNSRAAALALAVFCVATAFIFHSNLADGNQLLHFEKDLAIAGGLLILCASGPGRFSLRGLPFNYDASPRSNMLIQRAC